MKSVLEVILFLVLANLVTGQEIWDCATYPDEDGYQKRMAPMLQRIYEQGFGQRSLAHSKCPDTGLPVAIWAVEGENIISPYTGRRYMQGPTGYFGPKRRNDKGEIIAFGGDPLKYDLAPATASILLKNKDAERAKAFLSIPGNLRQQYHFACKNWARFYPLLAEQMGEKWKNEFHNWVGIYSEKQKPSDDGSQMLMLSEAHTLPGNADELLGGNDFDGGTENHKTMWRTSALLYSQLFPDTAIISGYGTEETEAITKKVLIDYIRKILECGNGEYDSQIYYPHSIEGFLNLYDFSPDKETRLMAKFLLDYYFATYGLKVMDGAIAGAQKRGYLPQQEPGEMEIMQWAYFNKTSRPMDDETVQIHQATTTYRPNKIIYDITVKDVSVPFEGKMSRPFYNMDHCHAFAESFYCSKSFAMGNVQMTIVDNPNQQMVWSVIAKGNDGPYAFSGGHPMRRSTSGHSPYTQTFQSKSTLLVLTTPTKHVDADTLIAPGYSKRIRANLWHLPKEEQGDNFEIRNRQKYAAKDLKPFTPLKGKTAKDYQSFFDSNQGSASTWFWYSNTLEPVSKKNIWFIDAGKTYLAIIPLTEKSEAAAPSEDIRETTRGSAGKFFSSYNLLIFPGEISGYVVEVAEKSVWKSMNMFQDAIFRKTKTDTSALKDNLVIKHVSISGDTIMMKYNPEGLRCQGWINGKVTDWDQFTDGASYVSPYVTVKDGKMVISNGKEGYVVEMKETCPEWTKLK